MLRIGRKVRPLVVWPAIVFALVSAPARCRAEGPADSKPAQSRPIEEWLEGEGLTGDWAGWRSRLADHGFTPYAVWVPEVLHNFDGGLKPRTEWEGLLEFGADFDLEKAVAWKGGALHVGALWIQGNNDPSTDFVGNFDELSNIAGNDALRLFQLDLTQKLDDGRWTFKVGQLALDSDFMISNTALLFLNSSFGPLPVESANTPAPIWPLGALGGFVRWTPRKHLILRMGVYNGDAGSENSNEHGFNYPIGSEQGAMMLAELELDATLLGRDTSTKIGGFYHSGDFTDFGSGRTVSDNYAVYVIVDRIWIGSRSDNLLATFFRAGWSPQDDRNAVHWYLDGGISARGFREGDRVGLAVTHAEFGHEFVDAQAAAGSPVVDDETTIELTYEAQLTPWLNLQPDLQYVVDPLNRNASDAVVGGLRGEITF